MRNELRDRGSGNSNGALRVTSSFSNLGGAVAPGAESSACDNDGKSWISFEDYAIAMIDELEKPKHSRKRFTVGY